ncbi:hypothetical protein ACMFMF_011817 [Clarireedia jacksonii]
MSWDMELGQTNVQNIMTARRTHYAYFWRPSMDSKLLTNENFTVSAIFFILEAAQISSSFRLLNADGKPPGEAFVAEFASKVFTYYSLLQNRIPEGRATPDHPFLLGYGLSQKLPDITKVAPDVGTKSTPKFFIPKFYNVTVTPSGSKFTGGNFNFCIMTHWDPDNQDLREIVPVDPSQNLNVGNWNRHSST